MSWKHPPHFCYQLSTSRSVYLSLLSGCRPSLWEFRFQSQFQVQSWESQHRDYIQLRCHLTFGGGEIWKITAHFSTALPLLLCAVPVSSLKLFIDVTLPLPCVNQFFGCGCIQSTEGKMGSILVAPCMVTGNKTAIISYSSCLNHCRKCSKYYGETFVSDKITLRTTNFSIKCIKF